MLDRIRNLAQLIKDKKTAGDRFVLMLGAGASLDSGIKPTKTIMEELVEKYARTTATLSVDDRFDQLWRDSSPDHRRLMIEPYLNRPPSSGYQRLAELIQAGYFDVVITFNFDRLLERALSDAGFQDYRAIIRGDTSTDAIATILRGKTPAVKILKMHGSLQSADYFLFSKEEMLNYPPNLEKVVRELTGRDIIVCGYGFNDTCVIRAFSPAKDDGSIYFVNPSGAVDNIKGFLIARRSQDRVIAGDLGRFDQFFEALHGALNGAGAAAPRSRQNLFKFLDHYQEDQKSWFLGRRKLTRQLVKRFERPSSPAVLCLSGKAKVGKTSFIRAGLIPHLDGSRYECIYIRCRKDVEPQLRAELEKRFSPEPAGSDWDTVLSRLGGLTTKRVVIFLDQFERPCRASEESAEKKAALLEFANALARHASDRLHVVLIAVDETPFWKLLAQLAGPKRMEEIGALSASRVASIVRHAARRGGVTLDPNLVATLCGEYRQSLDGASAKHPFTLMHVQTICYYLVRGFRPTWDGYDGLPQGLLAALDSIKEESSLIDLLDDLPSEERPLLRSFLKALCDPNGNARKIIEFIKTRFPEIREERFPEPIV